MKYIYNYLIVICIFILPIYGANGNKKNESKEDKGPCAIHDLEGNEFSEYNWRYGMDLDRIEDDEKIGKNFTLKTKFIKAVNYKVNEDTKYSYVKLSINNNSLIIEIDKDFKESYEEHETAQTMSIKAKFECADGKGKDLEFRIPIHDNNNHYPKFLNTSYNYKLPMPISKGFRFNYVKPIVARDVDLTNERITYKFEKDIIGFEIASSGKDENDVKNHPAVFLTTETINLENDISFVLNATDYGEPRLTTNTTITISIDKGNSFPRFSHPIYIANLTTLDYKKDKNVKLQFLEKKNISLVRGFEGGVKFEIREISDENKKHFKLTHGTKTDKGIDTFVELINITEEFARQKEIFVVLAVIKDHSKAQTVLRILLPEVKDVHDDKSVICKAESVNDNESSSSNGYMAATIVLSLVLVGLLIYVGYLVLYKSVRY